ncbi:hypothetical protein pb186bvf_002003 [Paramecium bursaria]
MKYFWKLELKIYCFIDIYQTKFLCTSKIYVAQQEEQLFIYRLCRTRILI